MLFLGLESYPMHRDQLGESGYGGRKRLNTWWVLIITAVGIAFVRGALGLLLGHRVTDVS